LLKRTFPLLTVLLALSACDSSSTLVQNDSAIEDGIEAPDRIRESFAVDFAQVTGTLTINNSSVSVQVEYSETLPDGRVLLLGQSEPIDQMVGNANLTVSISNDQFNYSFDDDVDGISNIVEREQGTDPFVPENSVNRQFLIQFNIPQRINDPAITRPIVLLNDIARATIPPDGDFLIISTGVVPSNTSVDGRPKRANSPGS